MGTRAAARDNSADSLNMDTRTDGHLRLVANKPAGIAAEVTDEPDRSYPTASAGARPNHAERDIQQTQPSRWPGGPRSTLTAVIRTSTRQTPGMTPLPIHTLDHVPIAVRKARDTRMAGTKLTVAIVTV